MSKMSFQGKGLVNRPNADGYIKFVDGKYVTSNKSDQDLLKKAGYKGKEIVEKKAGYKSKETSRGIRDIVTTNIKNKPKSQAKKKEEG